MSYNDKTKQYVYEYKAKNIKRVPLDMPITEYEQMKQAAAASGLTVNGFIKQAIRAAMVQASGADPVAGADGSGAGAGAGGVQAAGHTPPEGVSATGPISAGVTKSCNDRGQKPSQ